MKKSLLIILLICVSQVSFAKSNKVKKTQISEASNRPAFGPSSENHKVLLLGGLGPLNYVGGYGVSIHGGLQFRVADQQPIYVGFETGFDFFPSYSYDWYLASNNSGYIALPILATGMYRLEIPSVPKLHPYGTLAIGPSFAISGGRSLTIELGAGPGADWEFSDNLAVHLEVRIGVLGNGTLFSPRVGLTYFM